MKRATAVNKQQRKVLFHFNPRPREEGDAVTDLIFPTSYNFNPRPREEGDARPALNASIAAYFNPRPREEGDSAIFKNNNL